MNGKTFLSSENGSIPGNLLWFLTLATVTGISVDTVNAFRVQHQLQVATDASAVAAAAHIDDIQAAKTIAVELASRNLPEQLHGTAVTEELVQIGRYDPVTFGFVEMETDANAVRVSASRQGLNSVQTFLMWLSGVGSLEAHATSVAIALQSPSVGCTDGTILTSNFMSTGGNNTFNGSICIHGENGLQTGGNDFYSEDVRLSAASIDSVSIASTRPNSATADEVRAEQNLSPTIIPELNGMHSDLQAELSGEDGNEYRGSTLPSFMEGANVVELQASWVVLKEPGSLQPWEQNNPGVVEVQSNTVYLAPGSVTFEGNVDASNLAIVAQQSIIIGGGANLEFESVYFFAGQDINASGSVSWGDPATYCDDGTYNSYLFARSSLSLGGATGIYGVVGAAPRFSPGGAMESAGGLYFEATQYTSLGGNYNITGCGFVLESEIGLAEPEFEAANGATALVN